MATAENPSVPPFVHLHLHSEYSLLDGGNKIGRLVQRVKELGMDAVAVTDHGNLYGAVEFYNKAKAAGIKPILGIEAYVAPEDRTHKQPTGIADGGFHLVLLAENNTGWRHLLKLSSDSFRNGFYYKPRMDKSTLSQWGDGLIAINGHLGSSIAYHLTQYVQTGNESHYKSAVEEAKWHAQTFKPNDNGEPRFYIELQRHDTEEQERINPHLMKLAKELNLPLVCDNDAHFLTADDWDNHDSLCCISMGKMKTDASRLHYPKQLYVKSPQEMFERFEDVPEAMENTAKIAARCDVTIDFGANHAPVVQVVKNNGGTGVPPVHDEQDQTGGTPVPPVPEGSTEWFEAFCRQYELLPFDTESNPDLDQAKLKDDCDKALRELCEAGLLWRYGKDGITDAIRARLERELGILADKLISAYFLIVWDFVNWSRQRDIPASARGSGVGTMVGYVLGLSNACPERYGLLFERFTDPDRAEYPDIDIDMCQDGRGDAIEYVRQKYGHVAQIITFGRLKAKAAIKDVARVMGFTPGDGQRLADLVPNELNITLDAALAKEPDFKAEYDSRMDVKMVVDTARALEDHARHVGVHAAGVVIATQPLDNIVPLCKASGSDDIVTQWDGPTCEKVGLLKMDFLGLRTLSTIERAKTLIRESLSEEEIWTAVGATPPPLQGGGGGVGRAADGKAAASAKNGSPPPQPSPSRGREQSAAAPLPHPLDLDRLAYDDQKVLELFSRGDTAGIFQFESGGMRKLLLEMQPDRLEDLIAANALFRPGPMDLIPDYCARKHGKQQVPKAHEIVERYTAETYGIMIYQEQVMQIVHGLGDIPLREAYSLIKAISKKKHDVIDAMRPKFIEGAKEKGVSDAQANDLFDLILKFAGYGFNKSHSTGYAIIAYQTAYLKTYFPTYYMAALLTYESAAKKIEDWSVYLEDCKQTRFVDHADAKPHVGVEVRAPDINLSDANFAVVFDEDEPHDALHGHVRFGLGAIKGSGKAAVAGIIAEREKNGPFKSLFDFCERVPSRVANKATIEALVKAGTFDTIHGADQRAALMAAIDDAIAAGQTAAEDRRSGQMNIFAAFDEPASAAAADEPKHDERPLPSVPPWDEMTTLANEKQVLGFHISGHPLDQHVGMLRQFATHPIEAVAKLRHDAPVVLGGMLTRNRITMVRQGRSAGEKMAMITIMDKSASIDGVVFSDVFKAAASLLQDDAIVLLIGRVDLKRGQPQVIVEQVLAPEDAPRHLAKEIELRFIDNGSESSVVSDMQMAAGLLQQAGGAHNGGRAAEVSLRVVYESQEVMLKAGRMRVVAEPLLLSRLRDLLGPENVRIVAGPPTPRANNGNGRYRRSEQPVGT